MKIWLTRMAIMASIGGIGALAHAQAGQPQHSTDQRPGQADQGNQGAANADPQFLKDAYSINQAEVELGKLAQDRGTTDEVKDLGKRMVNDHSLALDQLKRIAGQHNMNMPDQLEKAQQQTYDQLSKLHGAAFDSAYLAHMKSGHKQAIDTFQKEATSGKNKALRDFAKKELPTLRAHEDIANIDIQQHHGK